MIEFYLDSYSSNNWGSSLRKDHPRVVLSGGHAVTVDCKDVAAIIGSYTKEDFIVLKMDIEGTEYELLIDFIKKGVFSLVDYMAIEFHPRFTKLKSSKQILVELMKATGVKFVEWD